MSPHTTPSLSAVDAWTTYLTAVEVAARTVCERVEDARPPRWPDLVPPHVPFPPGLEDLRRGVLATLVSASEAAQERRDALAAELAAMHPPRATAHSRAGSLGTTVDMMG